MTESLYHNISPKTDEVCDEYYAGTCNTNISDHRNVVFIVFLVNYHFSCIHLEYLLAKC